MSITIETDLQIPDPMKDPNFWIRHCLEDLFFLCTNVLTHGKKEEYHDLNWIHMALCDFIDIEKDPYLQKLILMSRDSLKSSISRADMLQWFLRKCYRHPVGKIGLFCGEKELAMDNLDKITHELLSNELLQSLFYQWIPQKKTDFRICTNEKLRYKGIEIDIGSPKRPLTGHHYEGIINDNLVNEANSTTSDLRKFIIRRWQQQESLLAENAWEKIYETTWEPDDLAGIILDTNARFDFKKIYRKPAHIFMSETGYKVFSCPARKEDGTPVFPEKIDNVYLERKRRKQAPYVYSRMYELQPIPDEEQVLDWNWIQHYTRTPDNFIRNMVVDCAGTTRRESSHSAISLVDWDELGRMHIAYAQKRKYTPMDLYRWMKEVLEESEQVEKRPVTFVGVEKEKYGIFLSAIVNEQDRKILVWEIDIRGRPRHRRIGALVPYYEQGKILSKPGLKAYEEEYREYYKEKDVGVDILDTIAYQLDIQMIPKKSVVPDEFVPNIPDEARRQFARERMAHGGLQRRLINAQF